jgi:outer membrane receptor protein involved in Fe transport
MHLTWRWIAGSENAEPRGNTNLGLSSDALVIPRIGTRNYLDLGVGYGFGENLHARLNVSNVFDTQPPMMANAVYSNNTDAGMYDIFGRSYFLGLSMQY